MANMLYEECRTCNGTGFLPQLAPLQAPCACKARRVMPIGMTAQQAESLEREIVRRNIRISGLEKEVKDWHRRCFERPTEMAAQPISLVDVLAWLATAPPLSLVQLQYAIRDVMELHAKGEPPSATDVPGADLGKGS